ncbi:hypothetical protein [Nostoc sp. FACHB-888]|nr:hypothetical protein [Nostoc sp. FACHB-888]MBD2246115.1 hypothetical protein [Nostoc sp. FACHB-888]
MLGTIFERFVEESPLSVMMRGLMERVPQYDPRHPHISTAKLLTQTKKSP